MVASGRCPQELPPWTTDSAANLPGSPWVSPAVQQPKPISRGENEEDHSGPRVDSGARAACGAGAGLDPGRFAGEYQDFGPGGGSRPGRCVSGAAAPSGRQAPARPLGGNPSQDRCDDRGREAEGPTPPADGRPGGEVLLLRDLDHRI